MSSRRLEYKAGTKQYIAEAVVVGGGLLGAVAGAIFLVPILIVSGSPSISSKTCVFAIICGYFRDDILHFGFSLVPHGGECWGHSRRHYKKPIFLTNVAFFRKL